jgi:hypothetical protein
MLDASNDTWNPQPLSPDVRLVLAGQCTSDASLTFVLALALYLKVIHGGKNKNGRIDSEKLAHQLAIHSRLFGVQSGPSRRLSRRPDG